MHPQSSVCFDEPLTVGSWFVLETCRGIRAVYGNFDSRARPWLFVKLKPSSAIAPSQPPVPPHLLGFFIQLTSVCGASTGSAVVVFCEMARWDSTNFSVVAKAQHEPEKEVGMSW